MEYTEKHKQFLSKLSVTLDDLIQLPPNKGEQFILSILVPIICLGGEDAELADDIISILNRRIAHD